MLIRILLVALVLSLGAVAGSGQAPEKSWKEWSKKEAEKVLNDSAWGQTYVEPGSTAVDTTVVTNTAGGLTGNRRGESGEPKSSGSMKYRVRLLTAKPIRSAFARMVTLQQSGNTDVESQLQAFVDRDFGEYLVVSLNIEADDPRRTQAIMAGLGKLDKEAIKSKVSLENADGAIAEFIDVRPPVDDGMGIKLVFSRKLNGQPLLSQGQGPARFTFELMPKKKVSVKFKVEDMIHDGKIEY